MYKENKCWKFARKTPVQEKPLTKPIILFVRVDNRGGIHREYATLCVGHIPAHASEWASPLPPPLRRCLFHTQWFPLLIRLMEGSSANVSASADAGIRPLARNSSIHLVKFSNSFAQVKLWIWRKALHRIKRGKEK